MCVCVCVCVWETICAPPPLSGTSVLLPRSMPAASRSHDLPSQGTVARQHPPSLLQSIKGDCVGGGVWERERERERDWSVFIEAVVKKRGNYVLSLKLNTPSPLLSLSFSVSSFLCVFLLRSLTCSGRFIHRCSEERGEMTRMHEECGSEKKKRKKKKKNTPQLWDIIQSIEMICFITKYEQLRIVQLHLHTR